MEERSQSGESGGTKPIGGRGPGARGQGRNKAGSGNDETKPIRGWLAVRRGVRGWRGSRMAKRSQSGENGETKPIGDQGSGARGQGRNTAGSGNDGTKPIGGVEGCASGDVSAGAGDRNVARAGNYETKPICGRGEQSQLGEKCETKPIRGWLRGRRGENDETKPIGGVEGCASGDVSPSPV